eukprot:TRINITY_DN12901_c2_g1_i3.p1 TRINITY_DN12901_c2_g1~~TRINITY_DN12901_c2_g1_i3.p1  ORF type:complete len:175 (-),score=42.03 TRINITY_DN12901_c2_g1_i3:154-600(-)
MAVESTREFSAYGSGAPNSCVAGSVLVAAAGGNGFRDVLGIHGNVDNGRGKADDHIECEATAPSTANAEKAASAAKAQSLARTVATWSGPLEFMQALQPIAPSIVGATASRKAHVPASTFAGSCSGVVGVCEATNNDGNEYAGRTIGD